MNYSIAGCEWWLSAWMGGMPPDLSRLEPRCRNAPPFNFISVLICSTDYNPGGSKSPKYNNNCNYYIRPTRCGISAIKKYPTLSGKRAQR